MNIETFREYCLNKKGVTEELPFDDQALVFKVMGKMFALTNINTFAQVNLKCEPEKAIELREQFDAVEPGYHMNKKHWNTVRMDGSIDDATVLGWVDKSYDLVVSGFPKKLREELLSL